MEGDLSDGMCRCCASEGSFKDFQVPYQWMGVEEIYGNMLKDCFDITLSVSEEANNGGICEVCITQLRNACNFKQQVQRTEEKFKKKLQEGAFKTEVIKTEISRFEDDDSNLSADEFSSQEYEVPIKVEKLEEKPKKRAAAKASTSKAKKSKASEGEPSVKRSRRHKTIEIRIGEQPRTPKRERPKRREPEIIFNKKGGELQKHRFNLRQILLNTNATPIRCRGGIGYACCFCTEQFPDPKDLKNHTTEFHDEKTKLNFMKGKDMYKFHAKLDITALKCNICNTDVNTLEEVIDHLNAVHNKELFTDIKHQVLPFKFDTESLQCCICHNGYHKFKSLLEHMNVHYRNHICEVCDAGFVSRVILAQHSESHKLGTFSCDYCAKTFDTFRKKRSHEKCIHTHSAKLNKCGYCNEKFKDYRKKERHLKEVHGINAQTLKCQACDKTFNNQKEYSVHLRRLHLMDKRYQCALCDMSFFSSAELKSHMVKHTGVRKFRCEICEKAYGRMKTLREHMRIHMDDRRFKCKHCGQAFVQKCSWRGHMRSKHGEQV